MYIIKYRERERERERERALGYGPKPGLTNAISNCDTGGFSERSLQNVQGHRVRPD